MTDKTWARVLDGVVHEVFTLDAEAVPGEDIFTPDFAKTLVDATKAKPQPAEGWTYDGKKFAPPEPEPEPPAQVPPVISDRQFGQGLWHDGLISYAECEAFVSVGAIPKAMQDIIDTLADDDTGQPTPRKEATILVKGAKEYQRSNELVDVIRQAQGWTVEQLDEHWRAWGAL